MAFQGMGTMPKVHQTFVCRVNYQCMMGGKWTYCAVLIARLLVTGRVAGTILVLGPLFIIINDLFEGVEAELGVMVPHGRASNWNLEFVTS